MTAIGFYDVVSLIALRSELRRTWRAIFEAIEASSAQMYQWARDSEIDVEATFIEAGGSPGALRIVQDLALDDVVDEEAREPNLAPIAFPGYP